MKCKYVFVIVVFSIQSVFAQEAPVVAHLGNCELESGEAIENCQVAYRLFGDLSPAKDNAVLVPTWFGGTSEDWISLLGPEAYIDTTKFHVIVVDAFGNGVSSSPSNSPTQPDLEFPDFTISDMVQSQHELLVEELGIPSLHAIVGISMGGMQAFEWSKAFPAFAKRIVPIVGSPKLGAYDKILWKTILRIIEKYQDQESAQENIAREIVPFLMLNGSTSGQINESIAPSEVDSVFDAAVQRFKTRNFSNYAAQLRAMLALNIYEEIDEDAVRISDVIESRMLVVTSPDDHVVTPFSAMSFAEEIGAEILSVPSSCGHGVYACELESIAPRVRSFLESMD